jgi:adhesin HecA-like repeat protein
LSDYRLLDDFQLSLTAQARERKRLFGVYPALVQSIADPDQQGRVRVRLPWAPDGGGGYEAWARLATLMAGASRGVWFIPDVGDEVLVAFEGGDARRPYVVGALWNGQDAPPEQMDSGEANNKKVIVSRNNIRITLDDSQGQESVTIETPGGQAVTLRDGPGSVEIADSNGNNLIMESAGITLRTGGKLTIEASTINVTSGMVSTDAGMSKFSGVVKADTVITNAVVSSSYTPGVGNIW